MIIFWKGWGVLTVVIFVVSVLGAVGLHDHVRTGEPYGSVAVLVLGGAVNWFVGRAFNRPLRAAGVGFTKQHSFFWIPMEWWSAVFVLYAVVIALAPR